MQAPSWICFANVRWTRNGIPEPEPLVTDPSWSPPWNSLNVESPTGCALRPVISSVNAVAGTIWSCLIRFLCFMRINKIMIPATRNNAIAGQRMARRRRCIEAFPVVEVGSVRSRSGKKTHMLDTNHAKGALW